MICKRCGKNNAEIYYKQTINGKTSEYALCKECAEELRKKGELDLGMPFSYDSFPNLFGIDDFFGITGLPKGTYGTKKTAVEKKKCTLCASTFDDLVKSGKVGCAECYKVFRDELRASIENIHGNAKYMGRQIKKTASESVDSFEAETHKEQSELEKLRVELSMAVEEQEYEKAAVLRDRIREIENNENNA